MRYNTYNTEIGEFIECIRRRHYGNRVSPTEGATVEREYLFCHCRINDTTHFGKPISKCCYRGVQPVLRQNAKKKEDDTDKQVATTSYNRLSKQNQTKKLIARYHYHLTRYNTYTIRQRAVADGSPSLFGSRLDVASRDEHKLNNNILLATVNTSYHHDICDVKISHSSRSCKTTTTLLT